jgi:putative transposase
MNARKKGKMKFGKANSDAGWTSFFNILTYKAEWAGKTVIAVNPKYTSRICYACGHNEKGNRKTQDQFKCLSCGHTANADHNAALNILARAALCGN